MRGEQLWKLGDVANAKVAFEEALASGNDRLVPARWMLANVHLKENHPDDALALLEPLEEPFPDQFEVVAGLGLAYYLKGDYETAVGYLSRARDIRPPDAMLWNALGDIYERLGDRDKAREAFESSIQLDKEQPTVRERLASLTAQAEKN
jgi:Flp pilus assembly protein TadD